MTEKLYRRKSKKDKEAEALARQQRRERKAYQDSVSNSGQFAFKPNIPKRNEHIRFNRLNPAVIPELLLAETTFIEDEELREREMEARKIAEARKKSVGIAYNKGAYQPIFDPKELGRK